MSTIVTRAGKGSALTWTEGDANFTNLNTDKLENVSEDLTPSLGGNLDVGGHSIVSASGLDINIEPGTTGNVNIITDTIRIGEASTDVILTSNTAGDLHITRGGGAANSSPSIELGGSGSQIILTATDVGVTKLVNTTDIITDTTGLSLRNASLDQIITLGIAGAYSCTLYNPTLTSTSNADINISPNGTGDILLTADTVRVGDANSAATITTNGTGNLVLNTNAGTNSGSITITQGSNANLVLTPNGTGKTATTNLTYNEAVYTGGTTTGTITPDCANGPVQSITLTGSITLNAFANPVSGQTLTLIVTQPSAGGPYTLSSTMKFAGGSKTLSTAANAIDIIVISYIGTTYYANLAKAFA